MTPGTLDRTQAFVALDKIYRESIDRVRCGDQEYHHESDDPRMYFDPVMDDVFDTR